MNAHWRKASLWRPLLALLACGTISSGCQLLGGLQVDAVKTQAAKPSNVTVYVSVRNSGVPLADLQIDQFHVSENELPLDSNQVGLRLLDRNLVAVHRVLVLLDLSGPINESGSLSLLATQVAPLVERLRASHAVSVYGFDGSEELTPLGNFERSASTSPAISKQDLARLVTYAQKDPSSNLNGAVTRALKELGRELAASDKPVAVGSLLVVARGPDLAGRTPEAMMVDAIDESPYQVYAVTVGKEDDTHLAELLGPSGHAQVKFFENLEIGFAEVARKVESDFGRYYFLSYCSPARAGERNLMLSVSTHDGDGSEVKGDISIPFDASGFSSGCDSGAPPMLGRGKSSQGNSAVAPPVEVSTSGGQSDVVPPPQNGDYAE